MKNFKRSECLKLKISLLNGAKTILPKYYKEFLHGMIYNNLPEERAEWLHEHGYQYEKRNFKLFVFSKIMEYGKYNRNKEEFIFPNRISFKIASPASWIIKDLANNIIQASQIRLGNNTLQVETIEKVPVKVNKNKVEVKAITPIETHSTFERMGRQKTHYYNPQEPEFSELVKKNLHKKWEALYNEECPYDLEIKPVKNRYLKESVQYFKKTIIKGWKGDYILKGNSKIIELALLSGLGSRNSAGYGMVEVK